MSDGTTFDKREFFDFNSIDGIFPNDVCPELRSAVLDLAAQFQPLTFRMLKYLAMALGKDN